MDALPNPMPKGAMHGQSPTSDACAKKCEATSSVWVWGGQSTNCYCTTLNSFGGRKISGDVSGCLETGSACVAGCGACAKKKPPAPPPAPAPGPPPPPGPQKPPLPVTPTREPNMNGKYQLSETKGSNTSKFPDYRDYPGGVEFFDVYSPLIVQLYSQVYWKALPPVQLPEEIRTKFDGRTMAFVGFEIDQVQNPTVPTAGGRSTRLFSPHLDFQGRF